MVRSPTPRRLLDLHARHTRLVEAVFGPESTGDATPVRIAVSLDIVVRLEPETAYPVEVLARLADYYLHSPTLKVPIEPLGLYARHLGEGRGPTLWEHYGEVLGVDHLVLPDGRVTLSERWARAGRFFGTAEDDVETFAASPLGTHLAGWRDSVFAACGPCATCPHFPFCGGFWLAPGGPPDACAAWRHALDAVREAWRATRQDEPKGARACRT